MPRTFAFALAVLVACSGPAAATSIWVEGENPARSDVTRHKWWYDKVKISELSGGEWISHWDEKKPGLVAYKVGVPAAGEYELWVRANPTQSSMSCRVGEGEWRKLSMVAATDRRNVAADGKADLRFLGWVRAGKHKLPKGTVLVLFKMESENHHHGAIDAFVLTDESFRPSGKAKPGRAPEPEAASSPEEADTWAFQPPRDPFTDKAALDLRYLNEEASGATGFIRRSPDGNGFVRGDGKPIRFWACGSGLYSPKGDRTPEDMDRHCRFLAKMGVNMVRIHTTVADTSKGAEITDVKDDLIKGIHRFVKACKASGIYVTISPFYGHFKVPASWGLEGYEAGKDMPWQALMTDPKMQKAYKVWTRELITRRNPHTGLAIKDDPTVAVLQVHNEDGLFFWTMQRMPDPQKTYLERDFGAWLKRKYGSLAKARSAWGGAKMDRDDFANGRAGIYGVWHLTQDMPDLEARLLDQTAFLAWYQHKFYKDMKAFFTEELGCKQLINASNWTAADRATLEAAERWTYTACDVVCKNNYCGAGKHFGKNRGYRIDPGHQYVNESVLRTPLDMPTNLKLPVGYPMMVTESTWRHPNLYQSEGPMLVAAYQSLTGLDAFFWFHAGAVTWLEDPRRMFWHVAEGPTGYAVDKWSCSTPGLMGMFPANALMYRLGYLAEGGPAVHEERTLESIFRRKMPLVAETRGFDPNVDTDALRKPGPEGTISRLAFLVGRVEVVYGGDPRKTRVADLARYIDPAKKTVRSVTDEITFDYGRGLATVDAPKAQGVTGFLGGGGGSYNLKNVRVESENDYATVQVVSMDETPLARSKKVLVQVGTTARLSGWKSKPATIAEKNRTIEGREIVATGQPPWRIANTKVTVTVRNPSLSKATLLDVAGYPEKGLEVTRAGGALTVKLPPNAMYVVLE